MRFLLEFVSCCGSPTQHRLDRTLPAEDEERWLVRVPPVVTPRPLGRNKRGRTGARGHDWRPSLGSISEDITVSSRERTNNDSAVVSTTRDVKRKTSGGGRGGGAAAAKARHRSYNDGDYRGAAMPTIMPTFSPTPFMF